MNEIIRKIASEAKLGGAQFEEGVRYYVGTEDTFNKFAELIVQECAQKLEKDGMVEVAMEIKDHFGIK